MFRLQLPTDPRWAELIELTLEDILTDHAYCEQKAASTCISLVQQFSDFPEVVHQVSPIVTEEWGHFRQVLAELNKRGWQLGKQRKDEYVNKLLAFQKKGGSRNEMLLEKLLVCALIEARSCERFRILSEHLTDSYLKKFYRKFMESEAGHYTLFIKLALKYLPKDKVKARWKAYLAYEANMIQTLSLSSKKIH